MQRWGTKSWIVEKHNETLEDDTGATAQAGQEEANDLSVEDEDLSLPAIHRRRKVSGSLPAPKRLRGKAAVSREILQRRYALVAKQMQLGKTSQSLDAHPDDGEFILADGYKLTHSRDEESDPETFFDAPDPGPIKYITPAQPSLQANVGVTSSST